MGFEQQFIVQDNVMFPILSHFNLKLQDFLKDENNKKIYSGLKELKKSTITASKVNSLIDILLDISENKEQIINQEPQVKAYIFTVADYCASKTVSIIDNDISAIVSRLNQSKKYDLSNLRMLFERIVSIENIRECGYNGHNLKSLEEDCLNLLGGHIASGFDSLFDTITDKKPVDLKRLNYIASVLPYFIELSKGQKNYDELANGCFFSLLNIIVQDSEFYITKIINDEDVHIDEAELHFEIVYSHLNTLIKYTKEDEELKGLIEEGLAIASGAWDLIHSSEMNEDRKWCFHKIRLWLNESLNLYRLAKSKGFDEYVESTKSVSDMLYDKLIIYSIYDRSLCPSKLIIDAKKEMRMPIVSKRFDVQSGIDYESRYSIQ